MRKRPGPGADGSWATQRRAFGWLDGALLIALGAMVILAFRSAETHSGAPAQWRVLGHYLLRPDGSPGLLLQGLFTTVRLAVWSGLLALPLGAAAGLARTSRHLYLRLMAGTYVEICRNLPLLVLVFLCYYFLAEQLTPLLSLQKTLSAAPEALKAAAEILIGRLDQADAFATACVTLGLYEGAYVAEIVRGAVQSVDRGQWEAGRAMGFPPLYLQMHIILPQAVRNAIPPLAGQVISTIKDSSIVSVISIQELTFQGSQLMATIYLPLEVWACVALLYFVLTFSCSLAASWLETCLRGLYTA